MKHLNALKKNAPLGHRQGRRNLIVWLLRGEHVTRDSCYQFAE